MRLQHLLYIPLALGLFASCKDDRNDVLNNPQPLQPTEQTQEQEGVGVSFTIGGEIEEMQDARSMTYALEDRNVRRGTNNPAWVGEFSPKASLREGETYAVYLVFLRKKDNPGDAPALFRTRQNFKAVKNAKGELILQFTGNINFPSYLTNKKFEDDINAGKGGSDSPWYVMGMIGFTTYQTGQDNGYTYHGTSNDSVDYRIGIGHANFFAEVGEDNYLNGVPLISQWHQVNLGKAIKNGKERIAGDALQLHFRPQGTLIQIDLGGDLSEEVEVRRHGLISNVFDFSGYYRLEDNDLYNRFEGRDNQGYGIPQWEADAPMLSGFELYHTEAGADGLSSGARAYPWHMPSISDRNTSTNGSNSIAKKIDISDASLGQAYLLGSKRSSRSKLTHSDQLPSNSWSFWSLGGHFNNTTRRVHLAWGMPKKQKPNNPYTYIWTSAYVPYGTEAGNNGTDDVYRYDFDPQVQISKTSNAISVYRQEVRDAEENNDQARVQQLKNTPLTINGISKLPEAWMAQYSVDSALYYGTLRPSFIQQTTFRTQPLIALYQTNYNNFQERQIYHVQSMVQSDLLITEVKYREENGKNYSAIEIYNPRMTHANLADYALVRLAPNASGTHLAFVKQDGTTTDDLQEAMLLPLVYSATKGASAPSQFAWNPTLVDARDTQRYADTSNGRAYIRNNYTTESKNSRGNYITEYKTKDHYDNSPLPLLAGEVLLRNQTLVIGASGYINDQIAKTTPNEYWIFDTEASSDKVFQTLRLNNLFSYATGAEKFDDQGNVVGYGEGVTDYKPGHAFALVKGFNNENWQIIDATGPVGVLHTAFAGSYDDFKATFAGLQGKEFSVSRAEGVIFPFIAPFRTKRMTNKWSDDWEITEGTTHNLGVRSATTQHTYRGSIFQAYRKRTPLDAGWGPYWLGIPSITKDANSTPVKN